LHGHYFVSLAIEEGDEMTTRWPLILMAGLLIGACIPVVSGDQAGAQPRTVLSFGIVPQQAPSKLLESWGPVLRELEADTGYRFVFRTAPDIPTFEQRLATGEYDLAYMNPYHFTVFNRGDEGYQAVAKAADKRIRGILVVRKDAPFESLDELAGETLAFPAPAAFAASVLPRAHLTERGVPFESQYVSSHDSVYKSVARGLYAAGGGVERTFNATEPRVREQLRVLWTTPGYTPHAIAAHPRLSAAIVRRVRRALLGMAASGDGRRALLPLKVTGFAAAENTDWNDVRALEITTAVGNTDAGR
jgi:phosphonate transport system substrate-binding protein